MWNGLEINEWLNNDDDLEEVAVSIRDALVVAVTALGQQEDYREKALDEITKILGIHG